MYNKIKQFLKHSTIYSIGIIATKGVGVITLPIYTKFISVPEFGLFGLIEISIAILVEIFLLGQANSILMFNNSPEFAEEKKSNFFTIIISVLLVNIFFLLSFEFLKQPVLGLLNVGEEYYIYYSLGLVIVFLRVINLLFLYKIRADEKSVLYTLITLIKITLTLGFVIYFVGFERIGVLGILYSYLIAEGVIVLIQLPLMIKDMQFRIRKEVIDTAAKFGIPLIFGSIGIMLLNLSDRYMLWYFTNLEVVGLYDLGYRVAGVLNMFLIMPFNLTLLPSAYKMYKQPGDKRYYSKLMTYLCFVLVWMGLGLSLISKEIIKVFALNPDYWAAYTVVPIIVLAYIFSAARNFASLGLFLTKNTKHIAWITILAALINIGLNFWLIPIYGMMAAAYNTLFAFVVYYFLTKYFSDKYYYISYENWKLIKIFSAGILLYILSSLIEPENSWYFLGVKIMVFLTFPVILFFIKTYEPNEIQTIIKIIKYWKDPSNIKYQFISTIKNIKR